LEEAQKAQRSSFAQLEVQTAALQRTAMGLPWIAVEGRDDGTG